MDEPTEHLDDAKEKTAAFAMGLGRENSTRTKQVEYGRALESATARDGEEMGLVGPGCAADAFGEVQDDRRGRSLDLITKAGRRHAHACGQGRELDGHAIRIEPVDGESGHVLGDSRKGHDHLQFRPASGWPLVKGGQPEAG
jgi:hypothetical protein